MTMFTPPDDAGLPSQFVQVRAGNSMPVPCEYLDSAGIVPEMSIVSVHLFVQTCCAIFQR